MIAIAFGRTSKAVPFMLVHQGFLGKFLVKCSKNELFDFSVNVFIQFALFFLKAIDKMTKDSRGGHSNALSWKRSPHSPKLWAFFSSFKKYYLVEIINNFEIYQYLLLHVNYLVRSYILYFSSSFYSQIYLKNVFVLPVQ